MRLLTIMAPTQINSNTVGKIFSIVDRSTCPTPLQQVMLNMRNKQHAIGGVKTDECKNKYKNERVFHTCLIEGVILRTWTMYV